MLYFCPSQNRFLSFFTAQNTYTHTHTSIRKSVFVSKIPSNCELPCVYECMCFWCMSVWVRRRGGGGNLSHPQKTGFRAAPKLSLKVASGTRFGHLFGPWRPRALFKGPGGRGEGGILAPKSSFDTSSKSLAESGLWEILRVAFWARRPRALF